MEHGFDLLADRYAKHIKELPKEYITLISNTFNIKQDHKILDLGCGTGLLTFPLLMHSRYIEGLDISRNMIDIARQRKNGELIKWIEADVLEYPFPNSYYDLIIVYESIHLFPNIKQVLVNSTNGLKSHGFLCMGWCYYNWELILEKEIVDTFGNYGIAWGEWSYQKFYRFKDIINTKTIRTLTPTEEAHVNVPETWTVIEIVEYLTSISKVALLELKDIETIKKELFEVLLQKYGNQLIGETQYWIRYSQKI